MTRETPWAAYVKIADELRARIGELPPGSALPSEALLGNEFHVVRNTIRRALAILEDEGLIQTMPGKGRVVRPAPGTAGGHGLAAPVYRRIVSDLRASIDSGELAPRAQVPSESALMATYGVSRGTARQALTVLEAEGLVYARHGKGRFVHETGTSAPVDSPHEPGEPSR